MKTILIVEDDPTLQSAIESKLVAEDFTTIVTKDFNSAKAAINSQQVDLVWLDHYLGEAGGTGMDLLFYMKGQDQFKHIPVFVVSITATDAKVQEYLALGADKFFHKYTYKLADIVSEIKKFLV